MHGILTSEAGIGSHLDCLIL